MTGGTFSVSRRIWEHEEFAPSPFSEREAFLWIISEAAWKPRNKRVGRVVLSLGRGQLAHSTRFLADAWGWSHSKVRRFLDRLESRHMIERTTDTGVSVIFVTNYDAYQLSPKSTDTAAAQEPTRQRHSSGTNKKKGNKGNKDNTSSSDDGFEDFWAAVPRKVGKGGARRAYRVALNKTSPQILMEGIKDYAESVRGRDQKYVAHPATWLNQERWTDEQSKDTRTFRDKPQSEWDYKDREKAALQWL